MNRDTRVQPDSKVKMSALDDGGLKKQMQNRKQHTKIAKGGQSGISRYGSRISRTGSPTVVYVLMDPMGIEPSEKSWESKKYPPPAIKDRQRLMGMKSPIKVLWNC